MKGENRPDESCYQEYLSALLRGNRAGCNERVFRLADAGISAEVLYTDLFQRSLYQVGELWEQGKISVAVEHLATAITEQLLANLFPKLLSGRVKNGHKAIISCAVNEYHQVGARMVADIMEGYGWDAAFLGANTPADALLLMIQERKPDVVGLSASITPSLDHLVKMVEVVQANFYSQDIFVGGHAFIHEGADRMRPLRKTTCLHSLQRVKETIHPVWTPSA